MDAPLNANKTVSENWVDNVEVQEIEFVFLLVPGSLDEFGLGERKMRSKSSEVGDPEV